ncbi:MAG: hypothetical protein A3G41_07995 [Elusimicrobia bacterium RIFCSPLOWO2_12_FULL_59_9]|nr:MAG: hypothetical protein A3G41_07995 [Elusimicrobia bacterium RIFCSPLOWO2_12_FULL_59_9]
MLQQLITLILDPFLNIGQRLVWQIPNFVAAFVLVLAGLYLSRIFKTVFEQILEKAGFDQITSRVGINEVMARLGLGKSPTYALSFAVYWLILLVFIISASNAIQLTVVSELLQKFLMFFPKLVAAILVLAGGILFGGFLSDIVGDAARTNNLRGGETLSKGTYVTVIIFAGLMALDQLGLRAEILASSLNIVLASAGFCLALAFGLGGKDLAAEWLRETFKKK